MIVSVCSDIPMLREHVAAWRASGKRVALVPTMGALHAGHLALVAAAKEVADRIAVTIFVNPTQFQQGEDFASYPRTLEADCSLVEKAGADLVYTPLTKTMYPKAFATSVNVEGPAVAGLEDRFRPTHFAGVATVVAKLLMQAQPDVVLFGEKDYQQLLVIRRMVRDLDIPIEILGLPTVREEDGVALSSRNVYLDAAERARAPRLHQALEACAEAIAKDAPIGASVEAARKSLADSGFIIDYVEVRNAETLAAVRDGDAGPVRILAAVRLGRTRLIDNVGTVA